jgi:REP element-mobilizing transposase RayT
MTAPRQVLPGTTYLVTRRCSERRFLLRPSAATNRVFLYLLAVASRRFGIRLHAYCVLSNHFHLLLTDPRGALPAFSQYLDSLVARALNASLGRWESFWAPNSYSAVALQTPADVIAKAAYVLANPVAAGLVRRARDWPGLWSAPERIGGDSVTVERPEGFFRPNGPMPRSAALRLVRPPGFESDEEFGAQLEEALASLETQAAAALAADNRQFLGAEWVLAQKPTGRPAKGEPRRGLRPRVASRDKWKRIEALARLAQFARDYRSALAAWRRGVRDALFPPGTYQLRLAHCVRCAAAG